MWSVCRWLSQWWLVFATGFLFWLLGVDATLSDGFDNTCTVSGAWNVSRVIPRLYGWICKTLRLSLLVVEHHVVVMNGSSQSKKISDWILWVANFRFPFYEICVQNQWGHKVLRSIRVQLLLGWNTYLLFNSDIVNFVWKTNEGETESTVLFIYVLWRYFNHWWMRGSGHGVESFI